MVNYLLHRTSILRHFSLQHFTSVVISLQTFIWHCVPAKTLDKAHCYFVGFHTPEWREKAENGLIFYFQQLFLLLQPAAQRVCLSPSIFSVKENQVSDSWCVLSRYSTFIQSSPAIKQKLHLNDSLFPPKATVTGCYLLDLQSACCLCVLIWLTVGISASFSFGSSAAFPDCLCTCLCFWQQLFSNVHLTTENLFFRITTFDGPILS